ncbi:adenylate isopentenyltransferase 5, chloroplastic-like [Sesamum indicum]|uniref:adenylate dimethylallyltransferase (ADP/ATP-dependent) n=1 Tax=Sesamum indicum TaxID=4182 RepID=A0A8M8UKQ6_SESIN|nr:adenylate isopentenyltransferase 5, chloroplastic-like [Sesamum indicum]
MSISAWKPAQSSMTNFSVRGMMNKHQGKDKVVVVLGATGTGKSCLEIDLATRFGTEVINSDKIQVYKGLDIVTNMVSNEECSGVPHHLLRTIDPEVDFTVHDFVHHALLPADAIIQKNRLPIITGGSNSFIQALVINNTEFSSKYECCFLWMDVAIPVLHSYVSKRVDQMVNSGLVEEGNAIFDPKIRDYDYGIRRAIGVSEMDEFFRSEGLVDGETRAKLLKAGETRAKLLKATINEIKMNTCKLACRQFEKILRMRSEVGWQIYRLNATEVYLRCGGDANEAWEKLVLEPSTNMVAHFICNENIDPKPTAYEQLA